MSPAEASTGRPDVTRPLRRRAATALIGAVALGLASCGSTDDPRSAAASAATSGGTVATSTTSTDGSEHAHDASAETSDAITDLNGHEIQGAKAQDVMAESEPDKPLDRETRAVLQLQLIVARDVAMRYPTVADATAAGYRVIAGFGPGSGAHYIGGALGGMSSGAFDATKPLSILYDGVSPTSQIVGLMYFAIGDDAPEGFAGPNDHWHRHSNVCTKFGPNGQEVPFPPDSDVTEEQCAEVGGTFMTITGWMVHAWVVPSWESPQGVFSHENPNLRCADGTYNTDAVGLCEGS